MWFVSVSVGGQTKFACVDGPEFDGHLIDWDLAMRRMTTYKDKEALALSRIHEGGTIVPLRLKKTPVPVQGPEERVRNFDEVSLAILRTKP